MSKVKKLLLASSFLALAGTANAGYDFQLTDDDKLSFGGYIKIDARYVSGDVAYRPFWAGSGLGVPLAESASQFALFANETRFNMKYTHGEVMGFIEMDFYGGGGNEIISNSANPRIRHAFIKYKDVLVGQTWSTFMNTSAIAETADFAGPANGLVFIRQGQIRYTMGNLQVSLENPETYGGDPTQDSVPDVIAKYTFKGDWGNVSIGGLFRQLNVDSNNSETGVGYSVAGRIKTIGKDDLRFQLHGGNTGRYVGVVSAKDIVNGEAEETTSYIVAYRHFWDESIRSTLAYGYAKADLSGWESTQWSVNVFKNLTKQLAIGFEVGNFSRDDQDADSNYGQVSLKYVL